ncbi:MAG: hypothetical protein QGG42_15795 [Phycisphaerae bacterium]|jgi:hypothetical protein|nr:hypothetical protein [Phycisphaerae bacterium]
MNRRISFGHLAVCGLLVIPLLVLSARADNKAPKRPLKLKEVAEGYLKNRAGFKSFRCEFLYRIGSAPSLKDAVKNGPTKRVLTASCKWIINGKNICYMRVIDKKAKTAQTDSKANPKPTDIGGQKGYVAAIPLSARGYLTDGVRALTYNPDFVVNLMGPKRIDELIDGLSPRGTPWALGGLGPTITSNPGRWMLDGKLGKWSLLRTEKVKGGKRIVVQCKRESACLTYHFDPDRGFLPVRREYLLNDGRSSRIEITGVRKCPGGRWFPTRVVYVNMRANGDVWRVQEISLTTVDTKTKVQPQEMALTLRGGISVLHVDDMLSSFRLQRNERIGIKDLKALHERCNETAHRRRLKRAEQAGQKGPQPKQP